MGSQRVRHNWAELKFNYSLTSRIWPASVTSLFFCYCRLQFSSVVSDSLWPHGLQHTRFLCLGVCSNSCPSSWWYHPAISSSINPFSSHLQSFPASGSFPMSWLFTSDGQSIGASASASVLPVKFRVDFLEDWLVWYLCCPRDSQEFSSPTVQKHQLFGAQPSLWSNSHICTWLLDKPWLWLYRPLSAKWVSAF